MCRQFGRCGLDSPEDLGGASGKQVTGWRETDPAPDPLQ
jgi:hypothetical protein